MRQKIIDYGKASILVFTLVTLGLMLGLKYSKDAFEYTSGLTTAKPISQQQIGDDTTPDILIIYEAEVDGVKVYPSVIKESE